MMDNDDETGSQFCLMVDCYHFRRISHLLLVYSGEVLFKMTATNVDCSRKGDKNGSC